MERTHALGAIWQRLSLANLAGLLSLGSAAVHIIVMPEHFREWWGYGAFFAALASLQAIYGLGLLQSKARLSLSPWYLLAGILGTFLVMVLYAVTRTLGIPAFGPHAGHAEALDGLGLLSNGLELGLVATLSGMVVRLPSLGRQFWTRAGVIVAGILLLAGALVLASIATNESDEPSPSTSETSAATYVQDLTRALTRTEPAARYGGLVDLQVDATYATSEYFAAALPQDAAPRFLPEKYVVLLFTESSHAAPLAKEFPELILSLDGRRYLPDMTEEVTTSSHHRMTVVRFPIAPPQGTAHRVMTLTLPSGESMDWHMPLLLPVSVAPSATATEGFKLTPPLILALLGGMLAAMWPCLFQLTVFFIPALGGLTMSDASAGVSLRKRMSVVKAAFFFVLGFTVVYTAAGALIGFAAQRLGTMPDYLVWQRYLGIAGGILIIILALRVAAKVRAPLVCKMPVLSKMAHSQRPASPLEMMFAGLAFATGCMTCFGAAIVVTMVIYVGMAASPSLGALTMLVFSLGMGIPLVIAATAMAKVLPVLFKLEKVIPWMGLGASVLMVGFAILLITGNYMAATEWVFRVLPGAGS